MVLRTRMALAGLAMALAAAAGAPALAAGTGLYVGAIAGQSRYHQDRGELDAANDHVVSGSSSIHKADVAFGGVVGYRFIPGFAVEAGYVDLGKLDYQFSGVVAGLPKGGPGPYPERTSIAAKAKGPTLAALGILPLTPAWDVYGRFGLLFSRTTLSVDVELLPLPSSTSDSANSVDPMVGVGTAWHVGAHVALRAEYTRFVNVGDKNKTGERNVDLINLGVTYSF